MRRTTHRRYTQPMLASLSATCQALKEREQTVSVTTLVDANSVSKAIERDNAAVAKKLFLLWGRFVSLLPRDGKALCETLQATWLRDQRVVVGRSIAEHRGPHSEIAPAARDRRIPDFVQGAAVATSSKSEHLRQIVAQGAGEAPAAAAHVYRRRNDTEAF